MYKAFQFNFPTVTGNYSVSGLGFRPQGVVLIGSNKATLASLLTGLAGPGLCMGISALDYVDDTTVRGFSLGINGKTNPLGNVNLRGLVGALTMQTDAASAATVDYKAGSMTFDADGFTINVTVAAPGVRPIFGFAWGTDPDPNTEEEPFQTGAVTQQMSGAPTFADSFVARSALVLATIANTGFTDGYVDGEAWFSFGGGFYPEGALEKGWASSTIYSNVQAGSALGPQGFLYQIAWLDYSLLSQYNISDVISSIGPLLVEGYRRHRPDALESSTLINEGGGSVNFQHGVWWNDAGWCDYVTIPAGSTVTITPPPHIGEWKVMLFAHVNGANTGGCHLRYGFGVLDETVQSCVTLAEDGSFYQSSSACIATCTAAGAKVVTGAMAGDVVLTNPSDTEVFVVYHGWGRQVRGWIPQMYRWWSPGKRLSQRS